MTFDNRSVRSASVNARKRLLLGTAAAALLALPVHANPLGGTVTTGSASISSAPKTTTVHQTSEGVVIDWSSFNVGSGQTTTFVQPNSSAIAVNRVGSASASQILGTLDANGRIVIINGNGLLFGKNAKVSVGSLIATSTDGSDSDLLAGKFTKAGNQSASVVNRGAITAASHGTVALVAPNVSNSGIVQAKLGTVSLGGANAFTVDFKGDGLVSFATQGDVNGAASVVNTGKLAGANIAMTAHAAEGIATSVVTAEGIIQAKTAHNAGGTILLDAGNGTLTTSGTINAAGKTGGGQIETSGANVSIAGRVTAGKGGLWKIDPDDLTIDSTAATTIDNSLNTGNNVELQTTSTGTSSPPGNVNSTTGVGDINIDSALGWSTSNTLTIDAYHSININAPIAISGAGNLALQYNDASTDGALGFGFGASGFTGNVSYGATSNGGTLTINSTPYTLLYSMNDVQNIPVSGNFALADSLDATSVANWTPITAFAGDFNGLGNTISNLTINVSSGHAGLFGQINSTATLENIGLVGGSVTDMNDGAQIGGLVGANDGVIANSYTTGAVNGGSDANIGGLAGFNYDSITNAFATGAISGGDNSNVGGLAGQSYGTITNAYATGAVTDASSSSGSAGGLVGLNDGTIEDAYAIGAVYISGGGSSGSGGGGGGGLVGQNDGTIENSYATGALTGYLSPLGGLVGRSGIDNIANISDSYATGSVTAAYGFVGGFVGDNEASILTNTYETGHVSCAGSCLVGEFIGINKGLISASYWNEDRSGMATGVGYNGGSGTPIGLSAAGSSPFAQSSYSGFTFTTTGGTQGNAWVIVDADGSLNNAGGAAGGAMPMLASEYSTTIANAHQLQLMAMNSTATYTLSGNIDATTTGSSTDVWGSGGFIPVSGNSTTAFTGTFNGAGHTISNLTINSAQNYAGLFGVNFSTIENVGLVGGSVTDMAEIAGELVGLNGGKITNVYATGTVSDDGGEAGGLVGINGGGGKIMDAYATVNVSGSGGDFGGLVGSNNIGATISDAYATGAVSGDNNNIGGLAGLNEGTINDAYAMGVIRGDMNYAGGLVGENYQGTITDAYATGANIATNAIGIGGLVGDNTLGTVTDGYWDTATTGQATDPGGATGMTTAALQSALPAFVNTGSWGIVAGKSYPYLCFQAANCTGTPQAISGFIKQGAATEETLDVGLLVNGYVASPLASMASGVNGYYYELLAPSTLAKTGSDVLAYISDTGTTGNTITLDAKKSLANVNIHENELLVHSAATDSATLIGQLNTTMGSQTGAQLLYTTASGFTPGALVAVYATGSSFDFDTAFDVNGGGVYLNANGPVTESTGSIVANYLEGASVGGLSLTGANNAIGTFTTFANTGGGDIALSDNQNLIANAINAGAGDLTLTTTGTGSKIALTHTITADTLTLNAAGAISESAGNGNIVATTVTGSSAGGASLLGSNHFENFSDFSNDGGNISVLDAQTLNVGSSITNLANLISLQTSAGDINIDAPMSMQKLTLVSAGDVSEDKSTGEIFTHLLNVTAATGIDIEGANGIDKVGTDKTTSGSNIIVTAQN